MQRSRYSSVFRIRRRPRRTRLQTMVVVDDCHVRVDRGSLITLMGGDFYQYALHFSKYLGRTILCMPVYPRGPEKCFPHIDGWRNAQLTPLRPHWSTSRYLAKLPLMVASNVGPLIRALRRADVALLRLPAQNGWLAFTIAKLFRTPTVVAVVADVSTVSDTRDVQHQFVRALRRFGVWIDRRIENYICRRSLVFAYGTPIATRLRRAGCTNVHLSFTSLVSEADLQAPVTTRTGEATILYVGRLATEKGLQLLMDAVRIVAESEPVALNLVGDGPLRTDIEQVAASSSTPIALHGYIAAGAKLDQLFDSATIFVLPSLSEGIPKVLLKAMARGVPVVASSVGGVPDIIEDNVTGLLVPPNDPQILATAILRLIRSAQTRDEIVDGARLYARHHTLELQMHRMWTLVSDYVAASEGVG